MKILGTMEDVDWLPKPNSIRAVLDETLPPVELITASVGLIFDRDMLLMTRLRERDWDLPGGHIEPGETPEAAVRREIYEETAAEVQDLRVFCHMKVSIHGPKPDGFAYPYPTGYMVLYRGEVSSLDEFTPTEEAVERRLLTPDDVRQTEWFGKPGCAILYEAALSDAT